MSREKASMIKCLLKNRGQALGAESVSLNCGLATY